MRTHNIPSYYRKIKVILIMPPDLALLSTLIGSNYPRFKLIFMVPKVFEQLKFCIMSKRAAYVPLQTVQIQSTNSRYLKVKKVQLKLLIFQSKFSGPRKFTLTHQ